MRTAHHAASLREGLLLMALRMRSAHCAAPLRERVSLGVRVRKAAMALRAVLRMRSRSALWTGADGRCSAFGNAK